jgi:MTH538 TIR-like domain (DUF1863).
LALALKRFEQVSTYLDVLDPHLLNEAPRLTQHLREALDECTHLLAAVSNNTKNSWWVPFEIGLATEKDYPISTYALDETTLPDYLRKWPYLRTDHDLARYIHAALEELPGGRFMDLRKAGSATRANYAQSFHSRLQRDLGQR